MALTKGLDVAWCNYLSPITQANLIHLKILSKRFLSLDCRRARSPVNSARRHHMAQADVTLTMNITPTVVRTSPMSVKCILQ